MPTSPLFRLTPQHANLIAVAGALGKTLTFGHAPVSNLPWLMVNGVGVSFLAPGHGAIIDTSIANGKTISIVTQGHGTHVAET
jgi:hypothetical protein